MRLISPVVRPSFAASFRHKLTADAYLIGFDGALDYWVERLVSDQHEWRYLGVTHEYVHSTTAARKEKLPEIKVQHLCDSSSRTEKYQRDIRLLEKALKDEPNSTRYMFYLAQSYRDVGLGFQALEWYQKRAEQPGWIEETWYSLYQIARLKHQSAMPWPHIQDAYLAAYEFRHSRLEPLFQLAA